MIAAVVFTVSTFMASLDVSIVNVAIPRLSHDFHAPLASIDTVIVTYLVSLAVFLPASGWLGDRIGTKRSFLAALALFTTSSALCGAARNLPQLVIARAFQGAGGGLLLPVGMTILYRAFAPAERMRVARTLMVVTALGPALGPVLGGLLVTKLSWQWIFLVNVPTGIVAFLVGLFGLGEHRQHATQRFDLLGFLLAGSGLGLLMFALSDGSARGWTTAPIIGAGTMGLLLLAALVWAQLRIADPMLDLHLFDNRLFRTSATVMLLATAGYQGAIYLVTVYYQEGLGKSALIAGLSTFPTAIGGLFASQITSRLYPHIGPRRIIAVSLTGLAIVTGLMVVPGIDTNLWNMRILLFFAGMSMGSHMISNQIAGFSTITAASTGRASTLYNATRQVGPALGVGLVTTAVSVIGSRRLVEGLQRPDLGAYRVGFGLAATILVVAALGALFIDDRDAAATMGSLIEPDTHFPDASLSEIT